MYKKLTLHLLKRDWTIVQNIGNDFLDLVNPDYGEICITFKGMNSFLYVDRHFLSIYENINSYKVIKEWKNETFEPFLKYLEKLKIKK